MFKLKKVISTQAPKSETLAKIKLIGLVNRALIKALLFSSNKDDIIRLLLPLAPTLQQTPSEGSVISRFLPKPLDGTHNAYLHNLFAGISGSAAATSIMTTISSFSSTLLLAATTATLGAINIFGPEICKALSQKLAPIIAPYMPKEYSAFTASILEEALLSTSELLPRVAISENGTLQITMPSLSADDGVGPAHLVKYDTNHRTQTYRYHDSVSTYFESGNGTYHFEGVLSEFDRNVVHVSKIEVNDAGEKLVIESKTGRITYEGPEASKGRLRKIFQSQIIQEPVEATDPLSPLSTLQQQALKQRVGVHDTLFTIKLGRAVLGEPVQDQAGISITTNRIYTDYDVLLNFFGPVRIKDRASHDTRYSPTFLRLDLLAEKFTKGSLTKFLEKKFDAYIMALRKDPHLWTSILMNIYESQKSPLTTKKMIITISDNLRKNFGINFQYTQLTKWIESVYQEKITQLSSSDVINAFVIDPRHFLVQKMTDSFALTKKTTVEKWERRIKPLVSKMDTESYLEHRKKTEEKFTERFADVTVRETHTFRYKASQTLAKSSGPVVFTSTIVDGTAGEVTVSLDGFTVMIGDDPEVNAATYTHEGVHFLELKACNSRKTVQYEIMCNLTNKIYIDPQAFIQAIQVQRKSYANLFKSKITKEAFQRAGIPFNIEQESGTLKVHYMSMALEDVMKRDYKEINDHEIITNLTDIVTGPEMALCPHLTRAFAQVYIDKTSSPIDAFFVALTDADATSALNILHENPGILSENYNTKPLLWWVNQIQQWDTAASGGKPQGDYAKMGRLILKTKTKPITTKKNGGLRKRRDEL